MRKSAANLLKQAAGKLEQLDFAAAEKLYKEALVVQPHSAGPYMGLAMVYNRTARPTEALAILNKTWSAIESGKGKASDTVRAAVLAQTGLALQGLGRRPQALDCFRQAYALVPSHELVGWIERLDGHGMERSPVEKLVADGQQKLRAGHIDEAGAAFKAALQLNPDHAAALHGLGMVLREKKDLAGALPLLQQALIMEPENPEYCNSLGMLFQDRGEYEKAVTFHRRAAHLRPDYAVAHSNLGVAYKRLGRMEEAVEAYRRAIEINPAFPEVYNNLGNLLRLKGELHEAREQLLKALSLRPSYRDAEENLKAVEARLAAITPIPASVPKEAVRRKEGSRRSVARKAAKV